MSVTKRIKWQRALGQLRYNYEELGFIEQISKEYAVEFQAYYEQYCAKRGVNISELNISSKGRGAVELAIIYSSDIFDSQRRIKIHCPKF